MKQVLDLEGERLERFVDCFNERVNGTHDISYHDN